MRLNLFLLFILFLFTACASREHVADQYDDLVEKRDLRTSPRTVIFFLVDGLPIQAVASELNDGRLPNIRKYFIGDKNQFYTAHAPFPSLTYPSISSLLTERPVDQNGVYGNTIFRNKRTFDFQEVGDGPELNDMIKGKNIFARLKEKGLRTASFDYVFHADSTVHTSISDLGAGVAVLEKDYRYVDAKTIDSLRILFKDTSPQAWPDFIFVHIIGVDLTSHDLGPRSPKVKEYIESLDSQLSGVFQRLTAVENSKERQIMTLMSADHGFDLPVAKVLDTREKIHQLDPKIEIIDEGRFIGLYFPSYWSIERKTQFFQSQVQDPSIDIVAYQDDAKIEVESTNLSASVYYALGKCFDSSYKISILQNINGPVKVSASPWACPDQLDLTTRNLFYPFFISNLSHYFRAQNHPDGIIIAKPGVDFNNKYIGQHGGPTEEETLVPVLLHGAQIDNNGAVPAVWDLLKFM